MSGDVLTVKPEHLELVTSQLTRHDEVSSAGTLLLIEFTTLSDYLHYLRAASQSLVICGNSVMLYLAAAVSDFYIPESDMASNSHSFNFQFLLK